MQLSAPRAAWPTPIIVMLGAVVSACLAPLAAQDFQKDIVPFLNKYCYECHDAELEKGHLNLEGFKDDTRFFRDQRVWREVVNQVTSGEMPPAKKKVRPTAAEIEGLQTAVHKLLARAISKAKPDPGEITMRRLNRLELITRFVTSASSTVISPLTSRPTIRATASTTSVMCSRSRRST
ncbi:hypothetical protein EMGBS6_04550 [Opitutia bacterium]|nr:hypothetical protein EMGBS6_04550 [Opitutae bacterium]